MNPLPVMTQIFIKGLFSHRSAITNGTEGCQEMAETAQNNFPLEFNFVFCFSSRSLGSGILMELLSQITPIQKRAGALSGGSTGAVAGPGGPRDDRLYVGHLAQFRPEPPVTTDVSNQLWHDKMGRGGRSQGFFAGEEAQRQYPVWSSLTKTPSSPASWRDLSSASKSTLRSRAKSLWFCSFSGNKLASGPPFISSTEGRHGSL